MTHTGLCNDRTLSHPSMKLPQSHAHHSKSDTSAVQVNIDSVTYNYFNRMVLPHGWRQSIMGEFFVKFKAACEAEGIASVWDETNEHRVATVLSRLCFSSDEKSKPVKKTKAK